MDKIADRTAHGQVRAEMCTATAQVMDSGQRAADSGQGSNQTFGRWRETLLEFAVVVLTATVFSVRLVLGPVSGYIP